MYIYPSRTGLWTHDFMVALVRVLAADVSLTTELARGDGKADPKKVREFRALCAHASERLGTATQLAYEEAAIEELRSSAKSSREIARKLRTEAKGSGLKPSKGETVRRSRKVH